MLHNKKPAIGIITSRASESEQKQILSGILSQCEKVGSDAVIITNIYNFYQYVTEIEIENKIYELIDSERIDGLIFTAESINNDSLTPIILQHLRKRSDIPIVVTGSQIPGFDCIDNDVRADFADIARHLTEVHGFTRIDMLAGYEWHDSNQERISGLKSVLQEKGVPFGDENIIYGNYWTDSGEKLALEYINGIRPFPQAVVCANDYMAFGMTDTFFSHNVSLPDDITVVGYEHIGDRINHSPILTTYQRNRFALGQRAVNMIYSRITGIKTEDIPVNGCMVCGETCSCGTNREFLGKELDLVRKDQFYRNMNFSGCFEHRSALCHSLTDYISALREYSYLIRDADGIYLCLYENWCSRKNDITSDKDANSRTMVCYRITSPEDAGDKPMFFTRRLLFPPNLAGSGEKGFYYLLPFFSAGKDLGHLVIQYNHPDSYDSTFISWHQTAVNALCILQMRNDINTLLECHNLSEFHDSTTRLYNSAGLTNELNIALKRCSGNDTMLIVLIRTGLFYDNIRIDELHTSVRIDTELSDNFRHITNDSNEFLARISDKLYAFAAVGNYNEQSAALITDKINSIISHSPMYLSSCGIDSTVCTWAVVSADKADAAGVIDSLNKEISGKIRILSEKRENPQYCTFLNMRSMMYASPEKEWDAQQLCRDFHLSYGHFRAVYKSLFGISFHKDVIESRISYAKYLLITTSVSLSAIAYKCGYEDEKYFMRQFRQLTGTTPNKYRDVKNSEQEQNNDN